MKGLTYIFIALVLSSCSSNVISFYVVDEGSISAKSFSFYERDAQKLIPQQKTLDSLIERSIARELVRKGLKHTNNSDIIISFKITSGTSSTSNVDRPTYRSYYSPMYYPDYNVTTTNYKEGVLLIEVWSSDEQLLWQGSKPFKVRKSMSTRDLLIRNAQEVTASFKPNL